MKEIKMTTNEEPTQHKIECPECSQKADFQWLYEEFLQQLHKEIENIPLTYDSICPNCKETVTLPGYAWGRYCKPCNRKLSTPVSWLPVGGCAEDICAEILSKFRKT